MKNPRLCRGFFYFPKGIAEALPDNVTVLVDALLSSSSLWPRMLVHRLNFRPIEQDTATVPLEGGKADDLQICVDFPAVIHDLQSLTEQRCTLVEAQPFGVHIVENTAEGVVN